MAAAPIFKPAASASAASPARIAVILPRREGFNAGSFGAVSLTVRDFALHSAYRDGTYILGAATGSGFDGLHYLPQKVRKRWWESNTAAYARACLRELARLRPALIEIHNRPVLAPLLAGEVSAPLALHLHNDPWEMRGARTAAERAGLLSRCAAVYCVSEYIRERFMHGLSSGGEKLHVVYNGLDIPGRLPPKRKHILFAGRLTPEKGALEFAGALARLLPAHPQWKGVIIGGKHHRASTRPDAYEREVSAVAAALGGQAEVAGFCSHKDTMMAFAEAEIAVVPSLWNEAFGRTALEAMASGCALVTSGRGGLKEITGGDAALLVPEITVDSLVRALAALLEDDALRGQFRQAGRERARKFSIERCTKALDAARAGVLA